MAHESFEDAATARLMNERFVCVKVDREERPDIDAVYMDAVVSLTGQGGWPLTVFLTPEGEPFLGGTYFPPEPRHGMPSWPQVVVGVANAWHEQRAEIEETGRRILPRLAGAASLAPSEGDMDPASRFVFKHLMTKYNGDWSKMVANHVRCRRLVLSEKDRVGIGTFSPSDPKSQDITELTGSIDLATIGEVGVESDPRAYRFDGELNIANRGLMEFVEMLKVDEKFLYSLLTLSQEQSIKTGRFAMIYADEVILSHSNENEYIAFAGNRKSERLRPGSIREDRGNSNVGLQSMEHGGPRL